MIRAEATNTSLPDAIEWKAQEARKAEKRKREEAEKRPKLEEVTRGMPKDQREWMVKMMGL